ncbi:hypothetical protein TNCV_1141031 [Trichonephila clavipes]|nr:hypothetical protein TNCV_1141031 [Trichonephila clavipes]
MGILQIAVEPQVLSSTWWKGKRAEWLLTTHRVFSLKIGVEPNQSTVTCRMLKATANDRRHLVLCNDEFREP